MATIKYKTHKPCAARAAGGAGFWIWFLIVLRYLRTVLLELSRSQAKKQAKYQFANESLETTKIAGYDALNE